MPSDAIQHIFEIGEVVNVPCFVRGIAGTAAQPTLTLETKYSGFDGNKDTITTVDARQVIQDK